MGLLGKSGRRRVVSPVLLALGGAMTVWWLAMLSVIAVDPLDIYPWGVPVTFAASDYGPEASPYLFRAAAKNPEIDAFLIGGSMTVTFTRQMLNHAWGTRSAFNLSYKGPAAADQAMAMHEVLRANPKHVLLAFDWIYDGDRNSNVVFPSYLYDATPWNDLRLLSFNTLALTAEVLQGKPLWRDRWSMKLEMAERARLWQSFQSQESKIALSRLVGLHRNVDAATRRTCADFGSMNGLLLPFVREMSRRGTPLDIFIPPYSLAMYYARLDDVSPTFLENQLLLRRCLVQAADGLPHVRIFAFDSEGWLVGDMKNYLDAAHPYGDGIFEYMLHSMMMNEHRLTRANVDGELEDLRRRVVNFRPVER